MKMENLDDLILKFGDIISEAINSEISLDDIADAFQVSWADATYDIKTLGMKPIQRATIKE